jgi:hypothetical protein
MVQGMSFFRIVAIRFLVRASVVIFLGFTVLTSDKTGTVIILIHILATPKTHMTFLACVIVVSNIEAYPYSQIRYFTCIFVVL